MIHTESVHLIWSILVLLVTIFNEKPAIKKINLVDDQVFLKQQTDLKNLSITHSLGNKLKNFKNDLEWVNDLNKPYLFEKHSIWNRSSAISIHDAKNIFRVLMIIGLSILMALILVALFQ